jgi:hypothetical protein
LIVALGARHKQIDRTPGGVVLGPETRAAVVAALGELVAALPATAGVRR